METHVLTLKEKVQLTKDVYELRFDKPARFEYGAGQFMQCIVPDGDSHCLRSYSLSSAPARDYLEFCVKMLPNGKASALFQAMQIGDTVECKGPSGRFTNPSADMPLQFIATGVGLAPIAGILSDELEVKKNKQPMHLLFGVRHESDIFWLERLETLARDHENFSYTLTLSQPSEMWDAASGRVTAHLEACTIHASYFICGSAPMIKDVRAGLIEKKVNPSQIHFEIF